MMMRANMARGARQIVRWARRRYSKEPRLREAARQADAMLVSFPKSGRTWLRYLLSCYFAEVAKLDFQPDLATTFRVLPNFDLSPDRGIARFVGKRPGLPLIAVSHLTFDQRLFLDRPVIFLVRDPRDVIVSAYFHATRHKHVFDGTIDEFLDNSAYGLPSLTSFLNGWAGGLAGRRHIVISYEALQADPHGVVGSILRFLGVGCDDGALDRAIEAARFDKMQSRERTQGIPGHEYDQGDDQSLRMRKGKAKAYGDTLSPGQADRVMAMCHAGLTRAGRAVLACTEEASGAKPVRLGQAPDRLEGEACVSARS
jgi:Sulfotransferase domain.